MTIRTVDAIEESDPPRASEATRTETGRFRVDLAAASLCAAVGILISILPHLIWWPANDGPVYIADHDDLLYLSYGARAYFEHPSTLADPTRPAGGPVMYPRLQLVPGILAAKALGLGPMGVNLAWRAWAGLSVGLGWYLVLRCGIRRVWVAAALAIVLLSDIGLLSGWPLLKHAWSAARLAFGGYDRIFDDTPMLTFNWRIITPALSLGWLLLYISLLARALAHPSWARIAGAGLGFGLLFHVYFYYWTAAGLGLLMALALDAPHRRVYFHVGWIGGLVGLPPTISNMMLKRAYPADWLHRIDTFLPVAGPPEFVLRKGILAAAAIGLVWVWWRRRDLIFLWSLGAAGLILANHQVVSGMMIQNFHWIYPTGPAFVLLLTLLTVGELAPDGLPTRRVAGGLALLCGLMLASGLWMRALDAERTQMTRDIEAEYRRYRAQRLGPDVRPLLPNSVVAGAQDFVEFAAILEDQRPLEHYAVLFSPSIDNDEWDARIALNGYLRGLDRPTFEAEQVESLESAGGRTAGRGGVWGPWTRSPAKRAERIANRLEAYDRADSDPGAMLRQFGVRYVALPAGLAPPAYLDAGSIRLEAGPTWQLWELSPEG